MASNTLISIIMFMICFCITWQLKIPLSLLKKMAAIKDPDDFKSQLQNIEIEPELNDTGDANRTHIGGRPVGPRTKNAEDIAPNDPCSARPMTVVIPQDVNPSIILWPLCTKIKRCGGCCHAEAYECSPISTSYVYINVQVSRYPYDGAVKFDSAGTRIVPIVQHDECEAQCRVKSHHCSRYQRYNAEACECECVVSVVNCPTGKTWNPSKCSCVCSYVRTCGDSNLKFSPTTCKCELLEFISGGGGIDIDKVTIPDVKKETVAPRKQKPIKKEEDVTENKPVVVPVVPKLDIKTTQKPVVKKDCSNKPCPLFFVKFKNKAGECSCRMSM